MTVYLGKRRIDIKKLGRAHTAGDAVIWVPDQEVMFTGDIVECHSACYCGDAHYRDWEDTLANIADFEPKSIAPGRGDALVGEDMVARGVVWNLGKVFHRDGKMFEFNLAPEAGHNFPAFINLQQPYFERFLVDRIRQAQADGAPIEIRGKNRVEAVEIRQDQVVLDILMSTTLAGNWGWWKWRSWMTSKTPVD